ncbi:hypothetical protein P9869_05685, partial [Streptomyces ossamyceticus]|nr:hypothetical protein [Streptomyces ossamyceticus]
TLLSSQGTDASFVLTRDLLGLSSGRFPSVLRFQPYQIRFPFRFRSEFISGSRWRAFAYSFALRLPFGDSDFIRSF